MESWLQNKAVSTKVVSAMDYSTVWARSQQQMAILMKDNSWIIISMAKGYTHTTTMISIKAHTRTAWDSAMAKWNTQMAIYIRETGVMT